MKKRNEKERETLFFVQKINFKTLKKSVWNAFLSLQSLLKSPRNNRMKKNQGKIGYFYNHEK